MTETDQVKLIAAVKSSRKRLFSLVSKYLRVKRQTTAVSKKEAAALKRQIMMLEKFLKKVQAASFI